MRKIPILCFVLIQIWLRNVSAGHISSPDISVQEGRGFITELRTADYFGMLVKCAVQFNGETFDITPKTDKVHQTPRGEKIQSFSEDRCGVRVSGVNGESDGMWEIVAIDENLYRDSASFRVRVLPEKSINNSYSIERNPRSYTDLICSDNEHVSDCIYTDHQTNMEIETCQLRVQFPPEGSQYQYSCRYKSPGSMEEHYSFDVLNSTETTTNGVYSEVYDFNSSKVFYCATKNEVNLRGCYLEHVDSGSRFYVQDGLQDFRYSSYKTSLSSGDCNFEIPKPILANETGVWKMFLKDSRASNPYGCMFNLEADGEKEYESFKKESKIKQIRHTTADTIDISCANSPYPLDYCYLKSPSNKIYRKTSLELSLTVGLCLFERIPSESGSFICGFNAKNPNDRDLQTVFDVHYFEIETLIVEEEKINPDPNGEFRMKCTTAMMSPVTACYFISPSQQIYYLHSNEVKNDLFEYYGKGLEIGHCGIKFSRIESNEDYGNWTCIATVSAESKMNLSGQILVEKDTEKENHGEDVELVLLKDDPNVSLKQV